MTPNEYTKAINNIIKDADIRDRVLGLTACMMADLRKQKKYIVTAVDYGDSCDGKASVLRVFDDKDKAIKYIREDIKDVVRESGCALEPSFSRWYAWDRSHRNGCEWNVSEVEEQ